MDEKTLNGLSIFELRDLARKVGVFNPTVLKKRELISAICDIETGKAKPHVSKTKQGRPPKEIGGYDKLVEIFLPNDINELETKEELLYGGEDDDRLLFHSDPADNERHTATITYRGYLEELDTGSGTLRPRAIKESTTQREYVYVPSKFIAKYNLKGGDEILCRANLIREDRALIMISINEINGEKVKDYSTERRNFAEIPCSTTSQEINLVFQNQSECNLKLMYGDAIFTYADKESAYYGFLNRFLQDNKSQFDNVLCLCPTLLPYNYNLLKSLPAEMYTADFENTSSIQRKTSFLACNRARRLAEKGKNVLLIVESVTGLMSLEKDMFKEMPIAKNILSTARAFDQGSVTVVANVPPLNHEVIRNLFYSNFPILETVGLKLENGLIDFDNSYRK